MDELTKWAQNIQKKVYEKWEKEYPYVKSGIGVFYSSVIQEPEMMIISYQPAVPKNGFNKSKEDFCKIKDKDSANSYYNLEKKSPMSVEVRKFFNFDNGSKEWKNKKQEQLLKNSVIFPLIFFCSPNIKEWRKVCNRKEMEKFCFPKVVEIIERIKPQRILFIGVSTYKKLKKLSDEICEEEVLYCRTTKNGRKEKMAIKTKFEGHEIFVTMHFTGARIKIEDGNKVRDMFQKWLNI